MLLTVAARTAMVLVHFAFWVGPLWGDILGDRARNASRHEDYAACEARQKTALTVPEWPFSIGWAALALLTRRGSFLSASALVFLGVQGYTQYCETFGADPVSLLVAGLTLVVPAAGLAGLFRRGRRGLSAARDTPSAV